VHAAATVASAPAQPAVAAAASTAGATALATAALATTGISTTTFAAYHPTCTAHLAAHAGATVLAWRVEQPDASLPRTAGATLHRQQLLSASSELCPVPDVFVSWLLACSKACIPQTCALSIFTGRGDIPAVCT